MTTAICPFCNASLPPQEIKEGWCESCGKKLPAFVRETGAASPGREVSRTTRQPSTERAEPVQGRCNLCGLAQSGVTRCYLKVTGQSIGVTGNVNQRWVNVRCTCCPSCFGKGRSLQTLRYITLGVMFLLPALLCGGLGLLVDPLERQFNLPRSAIGVVVLAAFGLCVLVWILSPFYIRYATRQRLRQLLDPVLDERLKGLVGVNLWGWRHYVTAVREIPQNEPAVELRGL